VPSRDRRSLGDDIEARAVPRGFGIESNRPDTRRGEAECGTAALTPPGDDLVDVVTRLRLGGEGFYLRVGDGPTRASV